MRLCRKPAEFCSPSRLSFSCLASPKTETWILADFMSPDSSTMVTVTFFTRGSRTSVRMAMLTTSRMASAALRTRREDIGELKRAGHFLDLVRFQHVPFLDVVEVRE